MPLFNDNEVDDELGMFRPAQKERMYRGIANNEDPQVVFKAIQKQRLMNKKAIVLGDVVDFMDRNRLRGLHKELDTIAAQTRQNISKNHDISFLPLFHFILFIHIYIYINSILLFNYLFLTTFSSHIETRYIIILSLHPSLSI